MKKSKEWKVKYTTTEETLDKILREGWGWSGGSEESLTET